MKSLPQCHKDNKCAKMLRRCKMGKTCLVLISALMALTLFSACAVDQNAAPDVTPSLSESENLMIRGVLDNLLFDNFPVLSIGTIADNRISIGVNRSNEEMDGLAEEILSFISDTLTKHPDLSGMNIDLRVFQIEGTGPIVRIPVADNERGPVVFPAAPEAKPVTLEYATEVFKAWWVEGESARFIGEGTRRTSCRAEVHYWVTKCLRW